MFSVIPLRQAVRSDDSTLDAADASFSRAVDVLPALLVAS